MMIPIRSSRNACFLGNARSWIVFSVSMLFIVGVPVERVESGPSPSVTLSASHWTPIGPTQGQFGKMGSPGPFGGRIDVAAPDPSNSNVMYLGANNGGIWKTINWSNPNPTWTEITDKPQILSQAVHEHDLVVFNSNIILAGASGPGGGVMRSDDAGNTWGYLGNANFDLAEFGAIVVDPNVANAQTVYVAISGGSANFFLGSGLYKSTDGGTTWNDAGFGTFSGFVSDLLEIQEGGQTVLYAADTQNGQANGGAVYRSPDGGMTWTPTNFPTKAAGWGSIRLAGSTAPTEKIYASAIDASHGDGGVDYRFVTSDQGASWPPLLTWPDAAGPDLANPRTSHRSHHNVVAVDPANSNIVFVNTDLEANLQTLNPDGSEKYTEWVFKSTDGGQTWTSGPDGGGDPVSGSFDGTGVFVVTSDGGIHRDPVSGYDNRGGNLNTIEFYAFSLDPNDTRTGYGLFQDGPGILKYTGVVSWQYFQPPNQGEAGKIRVGFDQTTNSPRVYDLDPNTTDPVNSPTTAARFVYSDDGGQTWTPAITGLPTVVNGGVTTVDYASFPGKGSLVVDANNPKRLLLGLANYFDQVNNITTPGSVFETTTGGDPNNSDPKFGGNGWRNIGSDLAGFNMTISALAIAPSAPNTIFAGAEDGRVFKTTNAGNDCNPNCPTWSEVDTGLPLQGQRIMDLEIDPANPDHEFAVTSLFLGRDDMAPDYSGVFHVWVRNGGAWSPINGNLPTKLGGESLAVDWQQPTPVLYIGTLRGAYVSTNLGTTWTRIDTLPRTRVTDLDFMPGIHLLGAGTMGWGAWEILTQATPPTVTPPADQTSVEGASHVFGLGSFSDPDGGPWSVDIDWGDGTSDTTFNANAPGSLGSKTHKYAEEGLYTVTITVTDTLIDQSDSATFAVNGSDPPVAASGGFSFDANIFIDTGTQTLTTFTDPGGAEPNDFDPIPPTSAGHYAASISWGDGTTPGAISPLMPTSPTQVFTVTGNHIYTIESPVSGFNVVTTIDHEGVISTATSIAIVGHPGNVTGGGQIGDGLDFDFGVQPDQNSGFKGHLNYKDKANNIDLRSASITFVSILIDNKHATIKGTAMVNGMSGYTFDVRVEDNGESGQDSDRFRIQIAGPTSYDSNGFAANGGLLTAGNIQTHK
jgi:PKD domain/BNR/Asp-box repeat